MLPPLSLREHLRDRLMTDMLQECQMRMGSSSHFFMILESYTSQIISSCFRMFELHRYGILEVLNIQVRQHGFDSN